MPRPNRAWSRRRCPPFAPEEDQEIVQMVRCGLASEYYEQALPHRPFGEILERRLQLIEAGQVQRAKVL